MPSSTDEAPALQASSSENWEDRFFQTEHLRKDLHGRSFRGGVITLSAQGVKFLLGLVSTAALARLLRPQDFGLLAMVTSITSFVGLFKDLGLSTATVQRSRVTHAQASFLFWVTVALSLTVTLVVLALAPVIAWFYHEPRLVGITLVVSLNFIFGGLTVQHQALLRRQMQFKAIAIRDVIALACGIAIGITLAWFGFGYWSLVAVLSSTNVANCILVWTICRWRPGAFRRGVGARGMLAFGGNLTASNVLNYFTRNFDNILIGRVIGSGALGIYTKAYGLLMLPISQINFPMAAVLLPGLSQLQNDAREYAKLFVNAVRGIALITIPIVVFCFFFSRDVVLVLLGRKWLPVAAVFQLLAPAALFEAISFAPSWLCQSLGRSRRQFHYALVFTPICVAGFLIGIRWGIAGVALSYSITFSVLFWAYVWYSSKDSPVRFSEICVVFLAAFVPALLAGAIAWTLRSTLIQEVPPIISLILYGLIFLTIYFGAAMLMPRNRVLILSGVKSVRKAVHA
jgi:O-antigen/teichoic acid export membrane protein